MVWARLNIDEYANTVLNVIKAKFGLHDKSEALNRFVEMYGDEIVEKEASDEYVKKLIQIEKRHFKKYGRRKMSKKEFNQLFELS